MTNVPTPPGTRVRYYVETRTTRIPLHGGSILVGRNPDCDVVLLDERVSRHHALFRVVDDGVELISLGQLPVTINGAPASGAQTLREGDAVVVAETLFVLRREVVAVAEASVAWFVERDAGVLLRVGGERFLVGGLGHDHLVVPGWEPVVAALELVGERLVLEVLADDVTVDRPRQLGDLVTLPSGARVEHRGASFRVLALPADPSKPTRRPTLDELPSSVILTFLPRGGQLTVTVGARARRLYLSEKRCELVASLLRPPTPYAPGELIPDDVIAARLWPGGGGSRAEINTLIWRVRKDLASAGLDNVPLLDRSGGGLRLCLAPGGTGAISDA
jgi:hypothetical protein